METLKHAAHYLNKFYSIQVLYMAYTPGILKILYFLYIVSTCVMYPWVQAKTPKISEVLWLVIYGNVTNNDILKMLYGRWHSCHRVNNIELQGEDKVKNEKRRVKKNTRLQDISKYLIMK